MSTELTNVVEQVPDYLREYTGENVDNSEYQSPGGLPIWQLSFQGGKWQVRSGDTVKYVPNSEGYAAAYVDVIIVRANPAIRTKAFYEGTYVPGENKAPRCASSNGIAPDQRIANPISLACNGCPKDAWKDGIRPDGTKESGKDCKDYKLLAVVPLADPENAACNGPMLLRISPDSLGNSNEYRIAQDKANPPRALHAIITRLSMDTTTAYPKVVFERIGWIPPEVKLIVAKWRNNSHTDRVLQLDVPTWGSQSSSPPQHVAGMETAQQPTADVIAANQANSVAAIAAAQRVAAIKAAQEAAQAKAKMSAPNGHITPGVVTQPEPPTAPTPQPTAPTPPPPPPAPVAVTAPVDPALLARRAALVEAQARARAAEEELKALEAAAAEVPAAPPVTPVTVDPVLGTSAGSSKGLLEQLDAEFASIPG